MDKEYIIKETEKALKEAGMLFLEPKFQDEDIVSKGFANFATRIDYQVQNFLVKELDRIIPGSNIITEESDRNRFDVDKPTWILDPVDGTSNLMHDYHHSAISLGLFIDKSPAMGMIYNPTAGEMFLGLSGKGAYLNGKPIEVSKTGDMEYCMIGFGTTPYDRRKAQLTFDAVQKIFFSCQDIRRSGSAALDIAYVASGRMEGFFELNLQPWDFAAGSIILEEAGGRITRCDGSRLDVLSPGSILATNGIIHGKLMDFISYKK